MSYEKKTWADGDVITSEALNNLEQGCEDANTRMMEMTGILGQDANQKQTITLNKTAAELFAAAANGMLAQVTLTIPAGDEETITITAVLPCEAFRSVSGGQTGYVFKVRADTYSADKLFMAQNLSANDAVVLTEV